MKKVIRVFLMLLIAFMLISLTQVVKSQQLFTGSIKKELIPLYQFQIVKDTNFIIDTSYYFNEYLIAKVHTFDL